MAVVVCAASDTLVCGVTRAPWGLRPSPVRLCSLYENRLLPSPV